MTGRERIQYAEELAELHCQLKHEVLRRERDAAPGGLTLSQFHALFYLIRNEGCTHGELAQALGLQPSSVSGLVDRLIKLDLIQRRRNESDRRIVNLFMTVHGQKQIEGIKTRYAATIRELYSVLTPAELKKHVSLLRKVVSQASKAAVGLLLVLSARSAAAENPPSYTLDECVRIGLTQSVPAINAAREREIAQQNITRSRAEGLPQLLAKANYTRADVNLFQPRNSRTVGAEANWQLFAGGRTLAAIRGAKAYKQLTAEQERRIRAELVRDIAISYYDVLLAQTTVEVREQSVTQLKAFEKEAREKYQAGTASEFDWLSAKVKLANEEPLLIQDRNTLEVVRESFRNLTHLKTLDFKLSEPLRFSEFQVPLQEILDIGREQRPELREQAHLIDLRRQDVRRQRSTFSPRIEAFVDYNYTDPDPYGFIGTGNEGWTEHWTGGLRATWELFTGFTRGADLREKKLQLAIATDSLDDMERNIMLEIRTQWLRVRDSEVAIRATTESVGLAERALQIAKTRYDAGLGTHLDFTEANLELSNARLTRSIALKAHLEAVTRLKYAAGILLKEYE